MQQPRHDCDLIEDYNKTHGSVYCRNTASNVSKA
jgi:hypothetical protein